MVCVALYLALGGRARTENTNFKRIAEAMLPEERGRQRAGQHRAAR